ncbi:unnamed protein product [Didymodactylos carnosus]|uniref:Clusterin-associated protein 1 n=1 Tax=Didymodactylos carnosus TaxID=1234261 RepID=A0A815EB93_9BILA|nr:unnamed protein product [Didymodactylos carnosus]CAF1312347.1 unnamed protein product [Didymodactylos carnosus]CAF3935453.1 unnamed protein product [Didymodactylos carnosus]CAF4151086.1 unnamed protein product [Didymodactylos carnosus]
MTYRDISSLCEMTRVLSYPRLISMENFRQPNFPLVAELMKWLVKQYDAQADIPQDIDGEQDRVIFIRTVAQIIATKAHMKLNTKKLYQADGYAVKEILKVITPLYKALRDSEEKELEDDEDIGQNYRYAMNDDISTLKNARILCSTITQKGANLHELLGKELDAREARQEVINRSMELSEVEEGIKEAARAAKRELEKHQKMIDNVQIDEQALDEKIQKRREEKDRHQRRLDMLRSVRPSFMNDFEKFEQELNDLYSNYVLKFRIASYLEKELEGHFKNQREKVQEVSRQYMQSINSHITEQEQQMLNRQLNDPNEDIGEHSDEEESEDTSENESDEEDLGQQKMNMKMENGKSFGAMTGDLSDDEQPQDEYDNEDDELVAVQRQQKKMGGSRKRQQQRMPYDDDENF